MPGGEFIPVPGSTPDWRVPGYDNDGWPHGPIPINEPLPYKIQDAPGLQENDGISMDPHRAAYDTTVDRYFGTRHGAYGTPDGELGYAGQETGA